MGFWLFFFFNFIIWIDVTDVFPSNISLYLYISHALMKCFMTLTIFCTPSYVNGVLM